MNAPAHNPGGKVRIRLDDSVVGKAFLHGPGECYRTWLTRVWGRRPSRHEFLPAHFVLWIGLNPSTADASFNDPTIGREMEFSMALDCDALVKCNIADYRATQPQSLITPGVEPCSRINLPMIRDIAKYADRIVVGWGSMDKVRSLTHLAVSVESALRADGHQLWCLGLTKNGSPRHPLYVLGGTPLVEFKELRI
jgi:hypothetical protein